MRDLASYSPEEGVMELGVKVKSKHAEAVSRAAAAVLVDGEEIRAIYSANKIRPFIDTLVITNGRLMGVSKPDLANPPKAFRQIILGTEVSSYEIQEGSFSSPKLVVQTSSGPVSFPGLRQEDLPQIEQALERLRHEADPVATALRTSAEQETRQREATTETVIGRIGKKALEEVHAQCRPGETPRFIVAEGQAGALAAFTDRCLIIKKGPLTGLMTGSVGGGRVTTFMYSEITGIEYNGGWINGVLEILTPSYQGSANKDFWRGTNKSRNADSNDPWTLSNCLPLTKVIYEAARPQIDELRQMVARSKQPAPTPAPPTTNLATELRALADLRDSGVLDEQEFGAAKRKLLGT